LCLEFYKNLFSDNRVVTCVPTDGRTDGAALTGTPQGCDHA